MNFHIFTISNNFLELFLDSLRFKVYGQQCNRCSDERFQKPLWYKEEVDKVLNNVHQKIGEVS